jgi:hypothetical protein
MVIKRLVLMCGVSMIGLFLACGGGKGPSPTPSQPAKTAEPVEPSALPSSAFKAAITVIDPPAKLRAGQKETIRLKIKNNSDVQWWSRGARINSRPDNKFYLAAGNRWLKADGTLMTNMDGRYGIAQNLAPGEEAEVPLEITAPKEPGEYILEIDLIQEGVAWFSDKGSPTARTKISVVK